MVNVNIAFVKKRQSDFNRSFYTFFDIDKFYANFFYFFL